MQLEGISSLLGDSEPIDSINQDVMMQKDKLVPTYSVPFINVLLPSPAVEVEVEAEKVSGNLISDVRSPKEKKTLVDNRLEWKDVQAFLSNMRIQLIRDTNKTKSVGKSIIDKMIRGNRALQSLKFNVNYDRSSCNRGKNISS